MNAEEIRSFWINRADKNEMLLDLAKTSMKRLFHLDGMVYKEGALTPKTKELLGLVSSISLRCDDCILYHLIKCYTLDVNDDEIEETFTIAYVVSGSITVPHLRRAVDSWTHLKEIPKEFFID